MIYHAFYHNGRNLLIWLRPRNSLENWRLRFIFGGAWQHWSTVIRYLFDNISFPNLSPDQTNKCSKADELVNLYRRSIFDNTDRQPYYLLSVRKLQFTTPPDSKDPAHL